MNAPRCTCPTKFDDRSQAVVRAGLDRLCAVHGGKHVDQHCATCTCHVPIAQTPEIARAATEEEKKE